MSEDLIRMCESLTIQDKMELRSWLSDDIASSKKRIGKSPLRCSILLGEMADIMGVRNISYVSRNPMHVWARTMVSYQMNREGYLRKEIGHQMMKRHSAITHMIDKMRDALSLPEAYGDIIEIWNAFQKRIQDDIHY